MRSIRAILPLLLVAALFGGTRLAGIAHHLVAHSNTGHPHAAAHAHASSCCQHSCTSQRPAEREPAPEGPSRPHHHHHDCAVCAMLATLAACAPEIESIDAPPTLVVERLTPDHGRLGSIASLDRPRERGPPARA